MDKNPDHRPIVMLGGRPMDDRYCPSTITSLHLLAWLIAAAVFMGWNVSHLPPVPQGNLLLPLLQVFGLFIRSVIPATLLLGTYMILVDKLRGTPGSLQPGHWLLLIQTMIYLSFLTSSLAELGRGRFSLLIVFAIFVGAISALIGMVRCNDTRPWSLTFAFFASVLMLVMLSCLGLMPLLDAIGGLFIALLLTAWLSFWIALAAAIHIDRRDKIPRDTLHWLSTATIPVLMLWLPALVLYCGP